MYMYTILCGPVQPLLDASKIEFKHASFIDVVRCPVKGGGGVHAGRCGSGGRDSQSSPPPEAVPAMPDERAAN